MQLSSVSWRRPMASDQYREEQWSDSSLHPVILRNRTWSTGKTYSTTPLHITSLRMDEDVECINPISNSNKFGLNSWWESDPMIWDISAGKVWSLLQLESYRKNQCFVLWLGWVIIQMKMWLTPARALRIGLCNQHLVGFSTDQN